MSDRRHHPIFVAHPIDGTVDVEGRAEPTPYHLYDGTLLMVGCSADGEAARALLEAEGVAPLLDTSGRALAVVWLGDFSHASLGPHRELQLSLLTTTTPSATPPAPVPAHPFAVLRALTRRDVVMVCHGLWNDTARVVAYNRHHLNLDARPMTTRFELGEPRLEVACASADGDALVEAQLTLARRQDASTLWRALAHLGVGGVAAGFRSPFLEVGVLHTRRSADDRPRVAKTWSKPDRVVIRMIDDTDRLVVAAPRHRALDLRPAFIEQLHGVRFVYGRPGA